MLIRKNLATAHSEITKQLPLIKNSEEKATLISLQEQIAIILQQGEVLRAELKSIRPETPQIHIIKLCKDIEEKSVFFTRESTKPLKRRVATLLETAKSKSVMTSRYVQLLREIDETANCTLEEIKVIEMPSAPERKDEVILSDREKDLLTMTTFCGGKYIPFNQSDDPTCGQVKESNDAKYESSPGECLGRVLSWRDEIVNNGRFLLLPRVDVRTIKYQSPEVKSTELNTAWLSKHTDSKGLPDIVVIMLKNMRTYHLYDLYFDWENEVYSHATGIRKIPGTEEIEFIDPNKGLFVFPNRESFKLWFVWMINRYYCDEPIGFELRTIAVQPLSAIPSLPLGRTMRPSSNDILLCDIRSDLHTLDRNFEDPDFDEAPLFEKIKKSLALIHQPERLKPEIGRIHLELTKLKVAYLQKALVDQIMALTTYTGNAKNIQTLLAIINPILNRKETIPSILEEIIKVSYQLHDSHGSTVRFLFWKHSTPSNDFFEIMKDLDIQDTAQLQVANDKLTAFIIEKCAAATAPSESKLPETMSTIRK